MGVNMLDESPCIHYKQSLEIQYANCLFSTVTIHNKQCWEIIVYTFSCMPLIWWNQGVLSIGLYTKNIPIQTNKFFAWLNFDSNSYKVLNKKSFQTECTMYFEFLIKLPKFCLPCKNFCKVFYIVLSGKVNCLALFLWPTSYMILLQCT